MSWLDSIRDRDMPIICGASDTTLNVFVTISLRLSMGEPHAPVSTDVVKKLSVPVLFGPTYVDRFKKSIYSAERKFILQDPRRYQYWLYTRPGVRPKWTIHNNAKPLKRVGTVCDTQCIQSQVRYGFLADTTELDAWDSSLHANYRLNSINTRRQRLQKSCAHNS